MSGVVAGEAREKAKARALDEIERNLKRVGKLDDWSRTALCRATAAVDCGCYDAAVVDAGMALTPPGERSPQFRPDSEFQRLGVSDIETAIEALRREPALPWVTHSDGSVIRTVPLPPTLREGMTSFVSRRGTSRADPDSGCRSEPKVRHDAEPSKRKRRLPKRLRGSRR